MLFTFNENYGDSNSSGVTKNISIEELLLWCKKILENNGYKVIKKSETGD